MSILTENSKKMLVESMRECVSEVLHESTSLTSKQATEKIKFITESATYEQLLNITLNPHRQEKYQPAYVLEGAVAILHSACMTGRKHIGINAITEGALKLQKKTGAVITESMLDAALTAVNEGAGLKVVGKLLTEAISPNMAAIRDMLIDYQANLSRTGVPANKASIINAIANQGLSREYATNIVNSIEQGGNLNSILTRSYRDLSAKHANKILTLKAGDSLSLDQFRTLRRAMGGNSGLNGIVTPVKDASNNIIGYTLNRNLNSADKALLNRITSISRQPLGSGGMPSTKNIINSPAAKTPWGKIALGAAAVAGTGALAYQYYKNRKAMNRDIQNGIEQ